MSIALEIREFRIIALLMYLKFWDFREGKYLQFRYFGHLDKFYRWNGILDSRMKYLLFRRFRQTLDLWKVLQFRYIRNSNDAEYLQFRPFEIRMMEIFAISTFSTFE